MARVQLIETTRGAAMSAARIVAWLRQRAERAAVERLASRLLIEGFSPEMAVDRARALYRALRTPQITSSAVAIPEGSGGRKE